MRDAAAAGADSLLIADVPAIEAEPWANEMVEGGIQPVLIAAANTPPETLATVARLSEAYTYCVARAGITGVHAEARFDPGLIERVRHAGAPPPVFGFGIARPEHVRAALDAGAAGVISGSAIVQLVAGDDARTRVLEIVARMKAATLAD
jgi:tryptophan synthase alpha chain